MRDGSLKEAHHESDELFRLVPVQPVPAVLDLENLRPARLEVPVVLHDDICAFSASKEVPIPIGDSYREIEVLKHSVLGEQGVLDFCHEVTLREVGQVLVAQPLHLQAGIFCRGGDILVAPIGAPHQPAKLSENEAFEHAVGQHTYTFKNVPVAVAVQLDHFVDFSFRRRLVLRICYTDRVRVLDEPFAVKILRARRRGQEECL